MKLSKWGNSLAVRIPDSVIRALDLKEGDDITLSAQERHAFKVEKTPGRCELVERLKAYRGVLPADFKFDRQEANEC